MHEKAIAKLYRRELFGSLAIYVVMLFSTVYIARGMADSWLRTLLVTSPMLGFFLAVWAVARQVRRIDEYQRQIMLETLAIAAAVVAGASFTYGFLEGVGYPRLSMFTIWPLMGFVWGALACIRKAMGR